MAFRFREVPGGHVADFRADVEKPGVEWHAAQGTDALRGDGLPTSEAHCKGRAGFGDVDTRRSEGMVSGAVFVVLGKFKGCCGLCWDILGVFWLNIDFGMGGSVPKKGEIFFF